MYKIIKEMGTSENVYLQNIETLACLNLGRITTKMISILSEDGYNFETVETKEKRITFQEKWNFSVSTEVKDKLRKLAMPMKRPIRDQRKNKEEKDLYPNVKTTKQPVDVLDIIYGLN